MNKKKSTETYLIYRFTWGFCRRSDLVLFKGGCLVLRAPLGDPSRA